MGSTTTPSAALKRPVVGRKTVVGAVVAALLATGFIAANVAPAQAARGGFKDGKCYSQPTSKTSTVQAHRFLKTEPITLNVSASIDANCNMTYTVTAPNKGRAVKSWGLAYSDSHPGGLSGQQEPNTMSQTSLTGSDTVSIASIVGLAADDVMGVRVYVEYAGTATEGPEYYRYSAELPLY